MEVLKACSKLAEAEIERLHEEFWRKNPDGKMSKQAFQEFCEQHNKDSALRKLHNKLPMVLFDQDGNDSLDFVEFLTAKTFASATSSREALGYLFDLYDDNQKGRLDRSDFVALVTNMAGNAWMTETVSFWGALKLTRKLGLTMSPYVKGNKLEKEQFITECEKNPIIKDMFETEPN
ncbi:unnamed protein product [Rotaria magnacalcarata]